MARRAREAPQLAPEVALRELAADRRARADGQRAGQAVALRARVAELLEPPVALPVLVAEPREPVAPPRRR